MVRFKAFLQRVETVVNLPGKEESTITDSSGDRLRLSDASFQWGIESRKVERTEDAESLLGDEAGGEHDQEVLKNLNIQAKDGELIGIIGEVGSGKTSLLLSLAGETELVSGTAIKNGTIAYVEQDPFIISDTVLENILFGQPFD